MGKTEKGAVWLDKKIFSAYDYWQFWRNTADEDVKRFLKYFTELDMNELSNKINNEQDINKLKILLANEATTILHGSKAANESEETAKTTFVQGGIGKNIPEKKISRELIAKGVGILDLIFENGLSSSKSDARRILKNRGIKIDDKVVVDEKKVINLDEFSKKSYIKLSVGKKTHLKITIL